MIRILKDLTGRIIGAVEDTEILAIIESPKDNRFVTFVLFKNDHVEDLYYDLPVDHVISQLFPVRS